MTAHTPGPWHIVNSGPHWNNPAIINYNIAWSADDELVAEHVYKEADARLIAAAPELLAACLLWRDSKNDAEEFNAIDACEAAIAAATGVVA